ncbi:M20 aminoacylase family protein [Methylomarinum vadi]|uniref:M20 aminoacylase family protein n=1 Tax=Methylomarinum vadi TaxID=438855 RepID=UPI00068AAF32|nr:M20 aminoacylase family protein [Methylomarinum vadi]
MNIYPDIAMLHEEMRQWRRHFHQYPETAYEEQQTADFICRQLQSFGLEVECGLGVTGVVGILSVGQSKRKIALRADMDALFIEERNDVEYKSRHPGKMHACGHDGHSAMLLGAAKYLAENRHFDGTVYFIFQPAEEGRAGAKRMIDDGLFERFPAQAVFGLHNFPDIPAGHFAVKPGAMMASFDCFEIRLCGTATHAAMPHLGDDVMLAAAQTVTALQAIVSRHVNPVEAAVVSVTQIHGGNTWNAIPDEVVLRGTYRCFNTNVQALIENKIRHIAESVAQCFGLRADVKINPENPGYPVTWNSDAETAAAIAAAQAVVGSEAVDLQPVASMGSEDFAFMLQQKPGCYLWLGNGPGAGGCLLHNPHYDFNDDILPVGASYWVKLVEMQLAPVSCWNTGAVTSVI